VTGWHRSDVEKHLRADGWTKSVDHLPKKTRAFAAIQGWWYDPTFRAPHDLTCAAVEVCDLGVDGLGPGLCVAEHEHEDRYDHEFSDRWQLNPVMTGSSLIVDDGELVEE
jgi:hypothetical protein